MNKERIGRFTSSEIHRLLGYSRSKTWPGEKAVTYIEETAMEARLGRALNSESQARTLSWGHALERYVFDRILPIQYRYRGRKTIVHPEIPVWAGTPDVDRIDYYPNGDKAKIVGDQKCPFTLKSFCQFMDAKDITEIRENHTDGEKYYWQLVSNAILLDCDYAELLVYVPYKSELDDIREFISLFEGDLYQKCRWIQSADDEELPYLIEGGHYKNFNSILFPVSEEEKVYLTRHVLMAQDKLKEML